MTIQFTEAVGGPVPATEQELHWTQGRNLATGQRIRSAIFLGEQVSAGALAANLIGGPYLTYADLEAAAGAGSPVAVMARRFFDFRNSRVGKAKARVRIAVVAEKSDGTAAVQTFTFTTTATSAGTWIFLVGGFQVRVAVSAGMTAIQQAAAFVAAFNALDWGSKPPLVAAQMAPANDHKATLTATVKGAHLNSIGLSVLQDANCGTSVAISGSYMGAAAGTPGVGVQTGQLATIKTAILSTTDCGTIVTAWEDDATLEELVDLVNERANATNKIPSSLICAHNAHAETTLAAGYAAQAAWATALDSDDAQRVFCTGCWGSPNWNGDFAARFAACRAAETHFARSLNALRDDLLYPPAAGNGYTRAHLATLLAGGFTPYYVHDGQSELGICRAITARTDLGYMDQSKVDVADLVRDRVGDRLGLLDRPSIVADGAELPPVAHITTPAKVGTTILAELFTMQREGYLTNVKTLWESFVSELDGTELRQASPLEVVEQFHNHMIRWEVKV